MSLSRIASGNRNVSSWCIFRCHLTLAPLKVLPPENALWVPLHSNRCRVYTLGLWRDCVVVLGNQIINVANRFVPDVQACLGLHLPEHVAVLEPGVCKDAVYTTKYCDQLPHLLVRVVAFRSQREPTGEVFRRCESVGCPVQRVTAVIYSAARLWWRVYSAQILPF